MNAGAVVIHRQNKYINTFYQYGAVDAEHAIMPEAVGLRTNYIFQRMCTRGVFVHCGNGAYYLNAKAAVYFREARRKRLLVCLAIIIIIYFIYLFTGIR